MDPILALSIGKFTQPQFNSLWGPSHKMQTLYKYLLNSVKEEDVIAAADIDDEDAAWDSWGDPEEAEKVSSPPPPIGTLTISSPKHLSTISAGVTKKFVDADLSVMDIKVRYSTDPKLLTF